MRKNTVSLTDEEFDNWLNMLLSDNTEDMHLAVALADWEDERVRIPLKALRGYCYENYSRDPRDLRSVYDVLRIEMKREPSLEWGYAGSYNESLVYYKLKDKIKHHDRSRV